MPHKVDSHGLRTAGLIEETVSKMYSGQKKIRHIPDSEGAVVVDREGSRRGVGDEREGDGSKEALHVIWSGLEVGVSGKELRSTESIPASF